MDEDYSRFHMSQLPDAAAAPGDTASTPPTPAPRADPGARGPALPPAAERADPSAILLILAIALGAGLSALGGWMLGEYPFTGLMPYIAGVLFALVIAEVILSVSQRSGTVTAVAAAVCTVGGLGLGVWISTGRGIDPIPIGGWVALGLGAVVALFRGGIRVGGWPARSNRASS